MKLLASPKHSRVDDSRRKRHRADYTKPKPGGLVTTYGQWLDKVVETFGHETVASWDRVDVEPFSISLVRVRCNGAVFHAERVEWGDEPHEYAWTLHRGGKVGGRVGGRTLRHVILGAERIGSVDRARDLEDLVLMHAPRMPPQGWRLREWCLQEGRAVPEWG